MTEPVQTIRPLRNTAEYESALRRFESYFDNEPAPTTAEGDAFALLGLVIAKYEDEHFPIDPADPVDTIRLVMQSRGYSQSDLAEVLGSSSRASEILKRRRVLSVDHIRRLRRAWNIPADALIGHAAQDA